MFSRKIKLISCRFWRFLCRTSFSPVFYPTKSWYLGPPPRMSLSLSSERILGFVQIIPSKILVCKLYLDLNLSLQWLIPFSLESQLCTACGTNYPKTVISYNLSDFLLLWNSKSKCLLLDRQKWIILFLFIFFLMPK